MTAIAIKRVTAAKDPQFQSRVMYFMREHAETVFDRVEPNIVDVDLALAKALYAGQVNAYDMARIIVTNSTIGGNIDADNAVLDSSIEYAMITQDKFHDLAESYLASGLITIPAT